MGMELAARAGYDPVKAISMQRKLAIASHNWSQADFFRVHPNGETRVAALQAALPKLQPVSLATSSAPRVPLPVVATTAAPIAAARVNPVEGPVLTTMAALMERHSSGTAAGIEMPASAPAATVKVEIGKFSYQVERMARGETCAAAPVGELVEKGPGFESYRVACAGGAALHYKCEFGQCQKQAG